MSLNLQQSVYNDLDRLTSVKVADFPSWNYSVDGPSKIPGQIIKNIHSKTPFESVLFKYRPPITPVNPLNANSF